jgi:hypothetical protein
MMSPASGRSSICKFKCQETNEDIFLDESPSEEKPSQALIESMLYLQAMTE